MKKFASLMAFLVVAGVMMVDAPQQVDAQKYYMDAFIEKYEGVADQVKEKKCGVCHGKSKKKRSDYGMALEKALGKKKQKDQDKIDEAFDTIAEMKPEGSDKTYGEMLADGELPAPYEEE